MCQKFNDISDTYIIINILYYDDIRLIEWEINE